MDKTGKWPDIISIRRTKMGSEKLTNEQVGAISRAHYNLKAALQPLSGSPFGKHKDIEFAIKELESVFTWLNIYQAVHKED